MKQFLYKTIMIIVAVVLIYEFTIAKQIKKMSSKVDIFLSKEGRKEGVEKIRKELRKAIKKERYLSDEDAKLINQFINKIMIELSEVKN